jgi:hypothetical protein
MIGVSSAGYAVNTPLRDVWITRKGEASKHRSPVREDTNDNGHITEEPCEVESLTHGFEAGAGGAIPSPTVTVAAPTGAVVNATVTGAAR